MKTLSSEGLKCSILSPSHHTSCMCAKPFNTRLHTVMQAARSHMLPSKAKQNPVSQLPAGHISSSRSSVETARAARSVTSSLHWKISSKVTCKGRPIHTRTEQAQPISPYCTFLLNVTAQTARSAATSTNSH